VGVAKFVWEFTRDRLIRLHDSTSRFVHDTTCRVFCGFGFNLEVLIRLGLHVCIHIGERAFMYMSVYICTVFKKNIPVTIHGCLVITFVFKLDLSIPHIYEWNHRKRRRPAPFSTAGPPHSPALFSRSNGYWSPGTPNPKVRHRSPPPRCDRTAKLNSLIKRNGHHLNASGALV